MPIGLLYWVDKEGSAVSLIWRLESSDRLLLQHSHCCHCDLEEISLAFILFFK